MDWARKLVALYQEQMSFAGEITTLSEQFFKDDIEFDEAANEVLAQEHIPELMAALHARSRPAIRARSSSCRSRVAVTGQTERSGAAGEYDLLTETRDCPAGVRITGH